MTFKNKTQLFMLHFSGGNCYSFQFIKPHLPADYEFHPLELPGRGKRIKEELMLTEAAAIDDLVAQITSRRNRQPYLIFGHSMGAALGLKVCKRLEELRDPPERLIVAGNAGPGTGKEDKCRSKMNDEELKDELRKLGGVSEEVLGNDDLFNFFAPIMRSDFRILEEGEEITPEFKLRSPITAVMGDKEETSEKIGNWKNFTFSEFRSYLLPGNHFFIHDHPSDLMKIINNCYERPLVS